MTDPVRMPRRVIEADGPVRIRNLDDELPGAEELGRMSADAVMAQYETTARSVEAMGEEVKQRINKLQNCLDECHRDLTLLGEAAAQIREKGNLARVVIEEVNALSKDIRDTCEEFRRKVALS